MGHDEKFISGKDIAASYAFARYENHRQNYFVTSKNFGCIKFEPKQPEN
jgi:hypothetical protein